MENLIAGALKIEVIDGDSQLPIRLQFTGKSNDRHPGKVLGPYFSSVLAVAVDRQQSIEMHFEKLEHFNSSTITSLIQVLQESRQKNVKITMVYSGEQKWQKLSFDALRVFVKGDSLFELRSV